MAKPIQASNAFANERASRIKNIAGIWTPILREPRPALIITACLTLVVSRHDAVARPLSTGCSLPDVLASMDVYGNSP